MATNPDDIYQNIYKCTPRQVFEFILDALEANLVININGSPGIGKSAVVHKAAKFCNLFMKDHRVSTSAPEDFTGLPEFYTDDRGIRSAHFVPFTDIFPIEGMEIPKDYEGWLVFLDEFNSGTKMVQAASYKTILDRMSGQVNFHERVRLVCAGNLLTDRAIVEQMSTAMRSRLINIEMIHDHTEWMEDVAIPQNYDERIRGYLSYKKDELMDFDPQSEEANFCCPRTWENMHKLITDINGKPKPVLRSKLPLYAGTITSGSAANFVGYCEIADKLHTIEAVLADPTGTPIPQDVQEKWIVTTHLAERVTDKNLKDVNTYIERFTDSAFKITFWRTVMIRHPQLNTHPAYMQAMINLSRYFNKKP